MLALSSGALLGKYTFDKYENVEVQNVININDGVYMLKYGTYDDVDEMFERVTDVERYVYIQGEDKVRAYVGIFASKKNAAKVKKIYDDKKIKTSIEKVNIYNDEFIQNLNEYEKLLSAADDENSLLIIEKQILSCYEELVVEDE